MQEHIAFIGDIHGDAERLSVLLARLAHRDCRFVFLGDYIDRGPNSREVVEILLKIAVRHTDTIFLSGNHEIALMAFLSGKLSFLEYAWMGGVPTIRSYLGTAVKDVRNELAAAMPEQHFEFFANCRPFFETAGFVACHAGINPAYPENRQISEVVLGRHPSLFRNGHPLGKLVVCGHYLQSSHSPFVGNGVICLNTGSGAIGGLASALLYPEMTFLQA